MYICIYALIYIVHTEEIVFLLGGLLRQTGI